MHCAQIDAGGQIIASMVLVLNHAVNAVTSSSYCYVTRVSLVKQSTAYSQTYYTTNSDAYGSTSAVVYDRHQSVLPARVRAVTSATPLSSSATAHL
jgi:hypothetical protein